MNIDNIIEAHNRLERELQIALATMERKDTIREIREAILEIQNKCPHFDHNYNWEIVDDKCPYCGKRLN